MSRRGIRFFDKLAQCVVWRQSAGLFLLSSSDCPEQVLLARQDRATMTVVKGFGETNPKRTRMYLGQVCRERLLIHPQQIVPPRRSQSLKGSLSRPNLLEFILVNTVLAPLQQ
jgi:hypothetical protein